MAFQMFVKCFCIISGQLMGICTRREKLDAQTFVHIQSMS